MSSMTSGKFRIKRDRLSTLIDEHAKIYLEENWMDKAKDAWWNSPEDLDKAHEDLHSTDKKDGLHG